MRKNCSVIPGCKKAGAPFNTILTAWFFNHDTAKVVSTFYPLKHKVLKPLCLPTLREVKTFFLLRIYNMQYKLLLNFPVVGATSFLPLKIYNLEVSSSFLYFSDLDALFIVFAIPELSQRKTRDSLIYIRQHKWSSSIAQSSIFATHLSFKQRKHFF